MTPVRRLAGSCSAVLGCDRLDGREASRLVAVVVPGSNGLCLAGMGLRRGCDRTRFNALRRLATWSPKDSAESYGCPPERHTRGLEKGRGTEPRQADRGIPVGGRGCGRVRRCC